MSSHSQVTTSSSTVPASQVTVKTQEGTLFQVDLALIRQSKTFCQMYDDLKMCESDSFEFPIPTVTAKVFRKVLKWCKQRVGVPEPVIKEDPVTGVRVWFRFNKMEKVFFRKSPEKLAELLMAADYLDIKTLYLFCCQSMAALIQNKSPQEIRDMLQLPDDLTEEEKDNIRKRNVWSDY